MNGAISYNRIFLSKTNLWKYFLIYLVENISGIFFLLKKLIWEQHLTKILIEQIQHGAKLVGLFNNNKQSCLKVIKSALLPFHGSKDFFSIFFYQFVDQWNRITQSCPDISKKNRFETASWCIILEGVSYLSFKIDRTAEF
ncbi:hypothetical protein BpHYR1_040283 [Brachionus plicatilis]|uniref:Uncharacterized protein n=1 Tax=Brachionus plicatilis TaxID=10195 RepID=A0A3M7R834_BRAPC|nr:hypothetical protein BpHYR1_040283 [Brachionus plicatilis]